MKGHVYLKARVKSLAASGKELRKSERAVLKRARFNRDKDERLGFNDISEHTSHLRAQHRLIYIDRMDVRRHAFETHLAYAYVRGRPLSRLLRGLHTKPNWTMVRQLIFEATGTPVNLLDFANWYLEANLPREFAP